MAAWALTKSAQMYIEAFGRDSTPFGICDRMAAPRWGRRSVGHQYAHGDELWADFAPESPFSRLITAGIFPNELMPPALTCRKEPGS